MDIWKSQRLRKEGNATIDKVSAMKPGMGKIIGKVGISWCFGSPEIDRHIADNACWIDYTDTWSSKRVDWLSKIQSPHHHTSDYACGDFVQLNTGVTRARLLVRCMDDRQLFPGSIEAIPILDPVDVEGAYSHIASSYHSVQCHGRSHGWYYASFD